MTPGLSTCQATIPLAATLQAALRGDTKYPPLTGTIALKQAMRTKFPRDSGLRFTDADILIGHGGRQIIYDGLTATLDAGDQVIVPAPYWNAYPLIARMAGAEPDSCPARPRTVSCPITMRLRARSRGERNGSC